jgi:DNA-binding Xre family transcriptional regulator
MLNKIMVELGWSTQRLANETGISKRTLDHYRDGTRQMNLVNGLKIADALGVDAHELIRDS